MKPEKVFYLNLFFLTSLSSIDARCSTEIVSEIIRSKGVFVQGLQVDDGLIYESIGGYGESKIIIYKPREPEVQKQIYLPQNIFAEGLTVFQEKIYILTWKAGLCFVYDANTHKYLYKHNFSGEGWGLTNNGSELLLSNGSNVIQYRDPDSFELIKTVKVDDLNTGNDKLNELEYVDGLLYANVWRSNKIISIDLKSGSIKSAIDLSDLVDKVRSENHNAGVLNGIADGGDSTLWITGKNWSKLFQIRVE